MQIAEKFEKHYEDPDDPEECTSVCRWRIFNGYEILEEEEAITNDIGIVPQWGAEAVVDGVQRHFSLINPAKSDQRLVNLYTSNIAEKVAGVAKDRFTAPIGSIPSQYEDAYGSNSPKAIRYYRQWSDDGREYHKPEPGQQECTPIQALSEVAPAKPFIEGMKATMGIFDASIGQRSNETSGVAINQRKVEGENVNYHFPDNEARTWNRVGEILIWMIDELDKGKKSVPVRYENGKTGMVPLGVPYKHPKTQRVVTHELNAGNYAVHVQQGPSYDNAVEQKQEAEQALIAADPELMHSGVGVNWIRNSGRPGADEDADAWAAYLNLKMPGLIPDPNGPPPVPPQVAAQLQQLQQRLQTTNAFAQSLHEQISDQTGRATG